MNLWTFLIVLHKEHNFWAWQKLNQLYKSLGCQLCTLEHQHQVFCCSQKWRSKVYPIEPYKQHWSNRQKWQICLCNFLAQRVKSKRTCNTNSSFLWCNSTSKVSHEQLHCYTHQLRGFSRRSHNLRGFLYNNLAN